jgi:hypothetical protein
MDDLKAQARSVTKPTWAQHMLRTFFVGVLLLMTTGCSVYMAAHQPKAKDLSVLTPGTLRGQVIAELGAPVWTGEMGGDKADVFSFTQGYSTGAKTARALFHGVSDVFSLGLWEVISTPGEMIFSGTDMKIEVRYDKDDKVKSVKNLDSGKDVQGVKVDSDSKTATAPTRETPESSP